MNRPTSGVGALFADEMFLDLKINAAGALTLMTSKNRYESVIMAPSVST
jgi:hypothetical protein